jgi:glutamate-5-semialdehyde dehydrogenase
MAHSAREASRKLALLSNETRKATLLAIAEALEGNAERILAANAKDCATGKALIHRRDDASPVSGCGSKEWHR